MGLKVVITVCHYFHMTDIKTRCRPTKLPPVVQPDRTVCCIGPYCLSLACSCSNSFLLCIRYIIYRIRWSLAARKRFCDYGRHIFVQKLLLVKRSEGNDLPETWFVSLLYRSIYIPQDSLDFYCIIRYNKGPRKCWILPAKPTKLLL